MIVQNNVSTACFLYGKASAFCSIIFCCNKFSIESFSSTSSVNLIKQRSSLEMWGDCKLGCVQLGTMGQLNVLLFNIVLQYCSCLLMFGVLHWVILFD